MSNYYLSNNGNDNTIGTIDSPWLSLSKINALKAGDNIYIKRGDTFYGTIDLPDLLSTDKSLTVSSYGIGKKPIISCYKLLNLSASWVQDSANIWKIDLADISKFTGNVSSLDVNIGFLKIDNIIKPIKKWLKSDLSMQWDFYSDNTQYLYVYSVSNPTTLSSDIKAAPNNKLVGMRNSVKIINLELCGSGNHGIDGTVTNVYIGNCDIHEIGGSQLIGWGDGTTRFGNGVQLWKSSNDVLIEHNNIYDCYDVAFTMQGIIFGIGFSNIKYRNNTDWNNTQSFEVWSQGATANTGFLNCIYEDNISINAGYGWGYRVRNDKDKATALYIQMMEAPINDILVKNNIFYNPRQGVICSNVIENADVPEAYKSNNNYIFLKEGTLINNLKAFTAEQYDLYISITNLEKKSQFFILPTIENSIPGIISSMVGYLGKNTAQVKILQKSLDNLNGRLEDLRANNNFIQQTSKGVEVAHMNGFVKANGGYSTNKTDTIGNFYAPICEFKTSYNYGRMDMVMNYMTCGDSDMNRNGIGTVNLQIVGDNHIAQIDLDVFEILEFRTGTFSAQDFVAVIKVQDGTNITVGLYFNIGKKNNIKLAYQPTLLYSEDNAIRTNYAFFDKATLLTTLPSGTQIRPVLNNPTYIKIPKTGASAPSIMPSYIGQEFIDTTNRKVYKATGFNLVDWMVLN